MENKTVVTWDDVSNDIKDLVKFGLYTEKEVIEKLSKPINCEQTSYYSEPSYATKSNMTKKEAEFLFEHQGDYMNSWKLEMLLENGYELEANDKWNMFINELLDRREITKRQYSSWKDRFIKYQKIQFKR